MSGYSNRPIGAPIGQRPRSAWDRAVPNNGGGHWGQEQWGGKGGAKGAYGLGSGPQRPVGGGGVGTGPVRISKFDQGPNKASASVAPTTVRPSKAKVGTTLKLGGVHPDAQETDFWNFFAKVHVGVDGLKVERDASGQPTGNALVQLSEAWEGVDVVADTAMQRLRSADLLGWPLAVELVKRGPGVVISANPTAPPVIGACGSKGVPTTRFGVGPSSSVRPTVQSAGAAATAAAAKAAGTAAVAAAAAATPTLAPKLAGNKKTMICSYWKEGRCSRGTVCTFAHGEHELPGKEQQPDGPSSLDPEIRARLLAQHARMKRPGESVQTVPVPLKPTVGTTSTAAAAAMAAAKLPTGRKTQLCQYWKEGRCTRGNMCTFAHGEHELNQERPQGALPPACAPTSGPTVPLGLRPTGMRPTGIGMQASSSFPQPFPQPSVVPSLAQRLAAKGNMTQAGFRPRLLPTNERPTGPAWTPGGVPSLLSGGLSGTLGKIAAAKGLGKGKDGKDRKRSPSLCRTRTVGFIKCETMPGLNRPECETIEALNPVMAPEEEEKEEDPSVVKKSKFDVGPGQETCATPSDTGPPASVPTQVDVVVENLDDDAPEVEEAAGVGVVDGEENKAEAPEGSLSPAPPAPPEGGLDRGVQVLDCDDVEQNRGNVDGKCQGDALPEKPETAQGTEKPQDVSNVAEILDSDDEDGEIKDAPKKQEVPSVPMLAPGKDSKLLPRIPPVPKDFLVTEQGMLLLAQAYGLGLTLLQAMGWRPALGLGKQSTGWLEPVSVWTLNGKSTHFGNKDRRCLGLRRPRRFRDSDAESDSAQSLSSIRTHSTRSSRGKSSSSESSSRSRRRRGKRHKKRKSRSRSQRRTKKRKKAGSRSSSSSSSSSSRSSRSPRRKRSRSRSRRGKKSKSQSADEDKKGSTTAGANAVAAVAAAVGKQAEPKEIADKKREVLAKLTEMKNIEPRDQRAKEFRILLRQWHPDKNPDKADLATAVFQFLQKGKSLLNIGGPVES